MGRRDETPTGITQRKRVTSDAWSNTEGEITDESGKVLFARSGPTYAASQPDPSNTYPCTPVDRADSDRWSTRLAIAGQDFSWKVDGSNNEAEIAKLVDAIGMRGGGEIQLPPGTARCDHIDNKWPRVMIRGFGANGIHDVGPTTGGTTLYSLSAKPMLRHRTPYGGPTTQKNTGGGFVDLTILGNAVATCGLLVDSVNSFKYRLALLHFNGWGADFLCGVTGTDLGEAADNQRGYADLVIRQTQGAAASQGCIRLGGSSNANTSIDNQFHLGLVHADGTGLDMTNCDNNDLWITVRRISGSGTGLISRGGSAGGQPYARANRIWFYSSNTTGIVEGTDTGGVTVASKLSIDDIDLENGTPVPTIGTGCVVPITARQDRTLRRWAAVGLGLGDSAANAIAAQLGVGTSALRIQHTGSNHIALTDGTNVWGINIDSATGDIRINRAAGTGAVNVGNGAPVKLLGKLISEGAADSGGSGFKALRVPNT